MRDSAERQRRVAHIVATVRRLAVVDRTAFFLSLTGRQNALTGGKRVDGKTWRRLLTSLVKEGTVCEAAIACADQGRKRVIQRLFNVGVLEAMSEKEASTL